MDGDFFFLSLRSGSSFFGWGAGKTLDPMGHLFKFFEWEILDDFFFLGGDGLLMFGEFCCCLIISDFPTADFLHLHLFFKFLHLKFWWY